MSELGSLRIRAELVRINVFFSSSELLCVRFHSFIFFLASPVYPQRKFTSSPPAPVLVKSIIEIGSKRINIPSHILSPSLLWINSENVVVVAVGNGWLWWWGGTNESWPQVRYDFFLASPLKYQLTVEMASEASSREAKIIPEIYINTSSRASIVRKMDEKGKYFHRTIWKIQSKTCEFEWMMVLCPIFTVSVRLIHCAAVRNFAIFRELELGRMVVVYFGRWPSKSFVVFTIRPSSWSVSRLLEKEKQEMESLEMENIIKTRINKCFEFLDSKSFFVFFLNSQNS